MEKNDVLNGSKLIAKFMGYKYIPFNNDEGLEAGWWEKDINKIRQTRQGILLKMGKSNFLCRRHHELRYWNSWDWLMPVIHKIDTIQYDIHDKTYEDKINDVIAVWITEPREIMFQLVVEFIEWYNKRE